MTSLLQTGLFEAAPADWQRTGSFVDNMKLPVHRWFRFSAGFSADWVSAEIREAKRITDEVRIFDPFAGSGTTLLCGEQNDCTALGVEAHPFVARVAAAKLAHRKGASAFLPLARDVLGRAKRLSPSLERYPPLIRKCFSDEALAGLDSLRGAVQGILDGSPESELVWLALVSVLRTVSHVGTAPWQYVLPNKRKRNSLDPRDAFQTMAEMMSTDMASMRANGPEPQLIRGDARDCENVPAGFATLVITSPPYANNYDYADATRLEMTFMGEIEGWADLQESVRRFLVRSCSQHVTERTVALERVLAEEQLGPIRDELAAATAELGAVRLSRGGRKNYHLMAACYFSDMALVWRSLRRVCAPEARACFVIGDSAPYGVYLPVVQWMGALAVAAGFRSWSFEKIRDRNTKWKNRKHRVPLLEGHLWVEG